MKKLVTAFLLAIIAASLFAQAPDYFNYQAILRNPDGTPMSNRDVDIRIDLLKDHIQGASVYLESHSVRTDNLGMVVLKIGDGTFFDEINWEQGPYYLSITVDGNHLGTSQLLSVPYALYAKEAGSVEDEDSDPENELQTLSLNETETILSISGGNSVDLPLSPWTKVETGLYYPHYTRIGSVGWPRYPLDIQRNVYGHHSMVLARLRNYDESPRAYVSLALEAYGDLVEHTFNRSEFLLTSDEYDSIPSFNAMTAIRAGGNGFSVVADSTAGSIRFYTSDIEDQIFERARINPRGNMGVGTDDPKAKVHVKGGDVYVEDPGRGIVLTSPNGQQWRITIDNTGNLEQNQVSLK